MALTRLDNLVTKQHIYSPLLPSSKNTTTIDHSKAAMNSNIHGHQGHAINRMDLPLSLSATTAATTNYTANKSQRPNLDTYKQPYPIDHTQAFRGGHQIYSPLCAGSNQLFQKQHASSIYQMVNHAQLIRRSQSDDHQSSHQNNNHSSLHHQQVQQNYIGHRQSLHHEHHHHHHHLKPHTFTNITDNAIQVKPLAPEDYLRVAQTGDLIPNQSSSQQQTTIAKPAFLPFNPTYQLPTQTIVEGHSVAAYNLGGEMRLCLPQFVYTLSDRFSLKRIVATFEESNIDFSFTSQQQLMGFISVDALNPSSKVCPLIKLSDANRIGLKLYEACRRKVPYVSSPPSLKEICETISYENTDCDDCEGDDSDDDEYYETELMKPLDQQYLHLKPLHMIAAGASPFMNGHSDSLDSFECQPTTNILSDKQNHDNIRAITDGDTSIIKLTGENSPDKNSMESKIVVCNDLKKEDDRADKDNAHYPSGQNKLGIETETSIVEVQSKRTDNNHSDIDEKEYNVATVYSKHHEKSYLNQFKERDNRSFSSKADYCIRAMSIFETSTLRIRVSHRAFGKCSGYFYPDRLTSVGARCIECRTCRIFLSPRRFVGHSHPAENNVSHWNFDSYNWRNYISLSCKQEFNNLELEALRSHLESMFEIADEIEDINDPEYEFDVTPG